MDTAVEIYALADEYGVVRYIGKANTASVRFKGHLREKRRQTPLYRWLADMQRRGARPTMRVLEVCSSGDWPSCERRLIAEHRGSGALLNVASGGNEPFCPTETRAKNGRANARLIHDTPLRKRIWALKRSLGQSLKQGYVSESAKAKMRSAAQMAPHLFGEWATI